MWLDSRTQFFQPFFVGLIGAKLEKWLHKKIPDVLDLLLVPLFTLTIMSFLCALFIIGPFFHSIENMY